MSIQNPYAIQLIGIRDLSDRCDYRLDSVYFKSVGDSVITDGDVQVQVNIARYDDSAQLTIAMSGKVVVSCDRCLSDMDVDICATENLKVVYGNHYEDDGEQVTIDKREGWIDLADILFELIAIQVPLQHVHPEGECDEAMTNILNQMLVREEITQEE